jgi:hydroxypyruvate reductase
LALVAAQQLAGRHDRWLLAAGTDGTDGPTAEAGALVDGGTIGRGETEGLDATDCLLRADAGTFLEASGDLLHTGPTGTNVMDLVLAWKTE